MLETVRYETDRRIRGTVALVVIVGLYAAFAVALFPSIEAAAVDLERLVETYPEPLREAFGVEAIGTIEGFLAGELYNFVWVLLLGVYFAYRGGGTIAEDVERGRMDLLLALPLTRSRLLLETYASLLAPIVAVNVGVGTVVYAATVAIGEPIDPVGLVAVHAMSVPYLLVCASIGLAFSVAVSRVDVAQRGAMGSVFVLYLTESLAASADGYEALQSVSPTHYYAPTDVLVHGSYSLFDAGALLVATGGLLFASRLVFARRDL